MAVESAGRCSLHCAESFFSDDSGSSLGDELSVFGASGVAGLFSVGRCTGARSLAADSAGAVGGAKAGAVGGAKVGGGPVSGLRFGVVGCIPAAPLGGIAGMGIAW